MYLLHLFRPTRSPFLRDSRSCVLGGRQLIAATLLACVALLALGLCRVPIAAADGPQSVTFGCTGFPQQFSVPPGVTQLNVTVRGAAGAGEPGGFNGASSGGLGGITSGVMNVSPGTMLRITVGCRDGYGLARGGSGGSNAGLAADGNNGGGSSGITDDATGSPRIVAGGGGGADSAWSTRRPVAVMLPTSTEPSAAMTPGEPAERAAGPAPRRAQPGERVLRHQRRRRRR
jgi:hypothetical protein